MTGCVHQILLTCRIADNSRRRIVNLRGSLAYISFCPGQTVQVPLRVVIVDQEAQRRIQNAAFHGFGIAKELIDVLLCSKIANLQERIGRPDRVHFLIGRQPEIQDRLSGVAFRKGINIFQPIFWIGPVQIGDTFQQNRTIPVAFQAESLNSKFVTVDISAVFIRNHRIRVVYLCDDISAADIYCSLF